MKLSRKKFPFLYSKDVKWHFADDYREEQYPLQVKILMILYMKNL